MKEKEINLLGIRSKGVILCRSELIKGKSSSVVMEAITEEEENRIDKSSKYYGNIRYERSDGYIVNAEDIYLYGEINFNNSEDIRNIERFNLIDADDNNNWIHSNFNFDKGCFTTIDGYAKGYPTNDKIKWFKYCYVLLGKPQRIIIYKCPNAMRRK